VPHPLEVKNGDLVRLAPGPAMVIDQVPTGRLVLENEELIAAEDDVFRARRRLMNHGTVLVGLVLDQYGAVLANPQVSTFGAADLGREPGLRGAVLREIEDAIEALDDDAVLDDERIRNAARAAVRRALKLARDKRPIIEVQITRLGKEALEDLLDQAEPA
jgi:ribonuclease J